MNDNCADQHIPINYTTKIHTKIENTDALSVLNVNEQNLKGNSVVDAWQKWTIKKEIEIKKKQIEEQTYFFENKIKSARETIEKINKVNLNQKKVHEWIHKKAEIDNMVLRKKIKDKIQSNQETKEIEKKRELETKK
ncbi:hypothetical protein A3Q56_05444 [Intoshia linei]|uniref:Uncharacterized protein n=1 Tax=Intoshia linei TaxID=1819745 RepID=A0A177AZP6_9BILA|nr:hypothetical protein A3Q56_05444 [Intoshia linei]